MSKQDGSKLMTEKDEKSLDSFLRCCWNKSKLLRSLYNLLAHIKTKALTYLETFRFSRK